MLHLNVRMHLNSVNHKAENMNAIYSNTYIQGIKALADHK